MMENSAKSQENLPVILRESNSQWPVFLLDQIRFRRLTKEMVLNLSLKQLLSPIENHNVHYDTLLHFVIRQGGRCFNLTPSDHVEILRWVLASLGADAREWVLEPSVFGYAVKTNSIEAVELLLSAIGDKVIDLPKSPDKAGRTLLHLAAENTDARVIRVLFKTLGDKATEMCTMFDRDDNSPLHFAVENRNPKVIQYFLEVLGDKVIELCTLTQSMLLHHTCMSGNDPEVLRNLLEALGKNAAEICTIPNKEGQTPLHIVLHEAANGDDDELIAMLIQAMGDRIGDVCALSYPDYDAGHDVGSTPLCRAAYCEDIEIFNNMLTALGARVGKVCALRCESEDRTLLHFLIQEDFEEHTNILLEVLGAEAPNLCTVPDENGQTPLHLAVAKKEDYPDIYSNMLTVLAKADTLVIPLSLLNENPVSEIFLNHLKHTSSLHSLTLIQSTSKDGEDSLDDCKIALQALQTVSAKNATLTTIRCANISLYNIFQQIVRQEERPLNYVHILPPSRKLETTQLPPTNVKRVKKQHSSTSSQLYLRPTLEDKTHEYQDTEDQEEKIQGHQSLSP